MSSESELVVGYEILRGYCFGRDYGLWRPLYTHILAYIDLKISAKAMWYDLGEIV